MQEGDKAEEDSSGNSNHQDKDKDEDGHSNTDRTNEKKGRRLFRSELSAETCSMLMIKYRDCCC